MRLTMQSKLLLKVYEVLPFFWVPIFVTRLEITETLLTRLINGNASKYVAISKTIEALL